VKAAKRNLEMNIVGRSITAAAALLAISVTPSYAVTQTIADLGPNANVSLPSPTNSTGAFVEDYLFQIAGAASSFSVAITNVFFNNLAAKITGLNLQVFSCTVCAVGPTNSSGALVGGLTFTLTDGNPVFYVATLAGSLAGGNYFLRVTGTGGTAAAYGGPMSNTVVPVPGALPLMATGLGLLGFAAHRRRRKALAAA
jgi:hypothetical protein